MMTTVLRAVCAAVAFVSVAFVAPSLQTYYGNRADTGFRATYLDTEYGLLALFALVVAAGLPLLLPRRYRPLAIAMVLGLAVCLVLQQSFFIGGFGPVDGTKFDFQGIWLRSFAELVVWALVLGGSFLFVRRLAHNAVFVALLLVAWTALSGWHAISRVQRLEAREQNSGPAAFALSKQRNVVFWISDALQGDVTANILSKSPELQKSLQGFTYYPDATSHYKFTLFSFPTILTGRIGDGNLSAVEQVAAARKGDNLSRRLKTAGFDVNMVSTHEYCAAFETCDFYWSLVPMPDADLKAKASLINLALFRVTPGLLKRFVFDGVNGVGIYLLGGYSGDLRRRMLGQLGPQNDVYFFNRMNERLTSLASRPTFKVFHSRTAHAPFMLRPDCSVGEMSETKDAIVEQSRCQVSMFLAFVDRLKALGVYENTTIFWVSDHGARVAFGRANGEKLGPQMADSSATFAVKYAGARQKFSFSNRGVQLVDMAPTVLHELGMNDDGFDGDAIQTLTEVPRVRHFSDHKNYSQNGRMEADRYEVLGPRWQHSSWAKQDPSTFAGVNSPNTRH